MTAMPYTLTHLPTCTQMTSLDTYAQLSAPTNVIDLTLVKDNAVKTEPDDDSKVTAQSEDEDARRAGLSRRFLQPEDEAVDPSACVHTPPPKARRKDAAMMTPPSVGRCTLTPMNPVLVFD